MHNPPHVVGTTKQFQWTQTDTFKLCGKEETFHNDVGEVVDVNRRCKFEELFASFVHAMSEVFREIWVDVSCPVTALMLEAPEKD